MAIQKITSGILADGAIVAADIADGSITTAKIADANVTAAKLATGAALPSQSGNTTYYLTTDGTNSIWKAQTALAVANTQITGNITSSQIASNITLNGTTTVTTLVAGAGSNTAPAITASGDTNTGIFFPAADTIAFTEGGTEAMRIASDGEVGIGTTTIPTTNALIVKSNFGSATMRVFNTSGTNTYLVSWHNSTQECGTITTGSNTVGYNSNSDYRLKENIVPMSGALDKVAQLNPVTYTWKASGTAGQGFIAHELQEHFPEAVSGEKDAVDAEGKPIYQGMDTSFLVATLTKAIQEQQELIKQLQADVAALKG